MNRLNSLQDPDPARDESRRDERFRHQRRRLSEILTDLASDSSRERIGMSDLLNIMPGRTTAALVLVFSAPNALPMPPGVSGILGLPLIYLTAQMMLGQKPWLPKVISDRSITRADFATMVDRAAPVLARTERLLRLRWPLVVHPRVEPLIGALCLVLACVIALPIPLGNMLPAIAMCVICLGLIERDGLCTAIGILIAVVSLAVVAGVVWAMIKATLFVIMNAF